MRLFSTKRGNFQELVLGPLFPLIIVFAIFIILLSYTSAVSQSSYFEREFLTKDIGLMIESLKAAPNDVKINYPNNDLTKNLKFIINNEFIEAYPYNIDPKLAPSKTSKFLLFSSNMTVYDFTASPKIQLNQNGKNETYAVRLYFTKNSKGISSSLDQSNVPTSSEETLFRNLINTAISNWYETPRIYIDMMYNPSGKTYNISGKDALSGICNYLDIFGRQGIYPSNRCIYENSIEQRKKQAKDAEFVIILYVNEEKTSKETIDIYYVDNNDDAGKKSQKMAGLSLINLKSIYSDTEKKRIEEPLKSQVQQLTDRPAIVVEIGNLEKISRADLDKIGEGIFSAIKIYYT